MKRVAASVAVLVALALAVALLWRSSERALAVEAPIAHERETTPPERPPPIETPVESAVVEAETARASVPDGNVELQGDANSAEPARLSVLVRSSHNGRPIAGIRVTAFGGVPVGAMRDVEGSRARIGEAPRTDADGKAELELTPDVAHDVRVEDKDWPVAALAAGATFELVIELAQFEPVRVFGQLVDADTDAPVAGVVRSATNQLGGTYKRSSESGKGSFEPLAVPFDKGEVHPTDAQGRFELDADLRKRPFAAADAEGYARTIFALADGFADAEHALVVRLSRAATLLVRVRGRSREPVAAAQVKLTTRAYHLQQHETLLDFYSSSDPVWKASTDADGSARMEGLPPNVPLTVEIRAEGWPDRDEPEPLVLRPGETREVELVLGASATITGVLVDQLDAAIGEREMWCTRAEANAVGMFQPRPQSFTAATTDAQGRFRFDAVSPGKWWIGPARGDRGRVKDDVAAIGQLVEVRDTDTALDIVVRAPRGLYISGKVLEPNGSPASSCNVVAYFVGGRAFVDGRTDGEGLFSVGPLIDGTWKLRAQIPARQVAAEIAEARAGARDVVITLRQGGSIAGTVVDAASGEPVECEISYGRVDGDENGMSSSRPNAGGFQFEGVEPGVYSITARTRDGRTGTRGGIAVAPGERVDGVRVEVRPGAKLELAYDGPSRYAHCRMLCNGEPVLLTSFERGTIESTIVPPGAIEIRWREHDAYEVVHTQRTSLAAGERKRVELRVAR